MMTNFLLNVDRGKLSEIHSEYKSLTNYYKENEIFINSSLRFQLKQLLGFYDAFIEEAALDIEDKFNNLNYGGEVFYHEGHYFSNILDKIVTTKNEILKEMDNILGNEL